jgi:uncharacterized protein YbjT (DUF2867 family)
MANDRISCSLLVSEFRFRTKIAGIAAADMRDIAEAAAISLTEESHEEQTCDIVAPSLIGGPGNAALWSKLLGKEIKYTGHDFDQWNLQDRRLGGKFASAEPINEDLSAVGAGRRPGQRG